MLLFSFFEQLVYTVVILKKKRATEQIFALLVICLRMIKSLIILLLQALKSVVLYVILSPYDNEQSDLVHRISADKKLEEIPKYK